MPSVSGPRPSDGVSGPQKLPKSIRKLSKRLRSMTGKSRRVAKTTQVPAQSSNRMPEGRAPAYTMLAQVVGGQKAAPTRKAPEGEAEYEVVGKGAAKVVYVKSGQLGHSDPAAGKAFLTPREGLLRNRQKELESEKALMDTMKERAKEQGVSLKHLVTDYEEAKGAQRVNGKYTLTTARAKGSLDSEMRKGTHNAVNHGLQFLEGMAALHQLGFTHGDVKADQALIGTDETLKLSDWGFNSFS